MKPVKHAKKPQWRHAEDGKNHVARENGRSLCTKSIAVNGYVVVPPRESSSRNRYCYNCLFICLCKDRKLSPEDEFVLTDILNQEVEEKMIAARERKMGDLDQRSKDLEARAKQLDEIEKKAVEREKNLNVSARTAEAGKAFCTLSKIIAEDIVNTASPPWMRRW